MARKRRPDPLRHGHALGFLTYHLNAARDAGDLDLQDSLKVSIRELRAAPGLIDALRSLVDFGDETGVWPQVQAARDAIKKATGEP